MEETALPLNFSWQILDLTNQSHLDDLYELLSKHYVSSEDGTCQLFYSKDLLSWALNPSGSAKWLLGCRGNSKLCGFISAVEFCNYIVVSFLCVHSRLRDKRLAALLIKELTRLVSLKESDLTRVIYTTAGTVNKLVPTVRAGYYHRPLNVNKLLDSKFMTLGKRETYSRLQRLYKVPTIPASVQTYRMAEITDCDAICELLNKNNGVRPLWNPTDVAYWLMPRTDCLSSYVIESDDDIIGFFSYYYLQSIMNGYNINVAYLYYIAGSIPTIDLVQAAIATTTADVFNCLNIGDSSFLSELKFKQGDGGLNYYLSVDTNLANLGITLI
jgi:glycylpeptide N-tetradecanoyltransferase